MSFDLGKSGVSVLSDALDRLGISGQAEGVHAIGPATALCGPAFTVRMVPAEVRPRSVGDYIDDVLPGSIVVIDNAGRTDTTVWGGLLTFTAHARGIGGTVVHGVCRDSEELQTVPYPLFARAAHMRTGKDRVQAEEYNVPVSLGTARVSAGDWVVGDRDGVVVIPAADVGRVLEATRQIETAEVAIRAAVAAGQRLDEARRDFGYHALQTKT
jgi:4-hydroxy-4-methyl-2-oxoglutarate aldolase